MWDEPTFQRDLVKILLESGALALVGAAIVWFASRSLESYEASLSWSAELLKERASVAKDEAVGAGGRLLGSIEEAYEPRA